MLNCWHFIIYEKNNFNVYLDEYEHIIITSVLGFYNQNITVTPTEHMHDTRVCYFYVGRDTEFQTSHSKYFQERCMEAHYWHQI